MASVQGQAGQAQSPQTQPFAFSGSGGAYFRIWIVNLALTLLTLGIYSAWAKVRRLQYFYRNTALAGNSFDYHGNPLAILKGRVIGVLLLLLYNVLGSFHVGLGLLAFAALLGVAPWLIHRSISFRLHNSSYRGLRFRFSGSLGGAYQAFLLWPLLGYVTLGLLMPMAHREIKRYQHGNSHFGDAGFSFDAGAGAFYRIYLKLFGLLLLMGIGFALMAGGMAALGPLFGSDGEPRDKARLFGLIMAGILLFYLLLFLLIGPWFSARLQNLVWNGTALEGHRFHSSVRARDLFVIYLTNFIGIVLTLGLFKPFADIRLARYRLEHTVLQAQGSLDEFLAAREQAVSAVGEETADVFDVDISF